MIAAATSAPIAMKMLVRVNRGGFGVGLGMGVAVGTAARGAAAEPVSLHDNANDPGCEIFRPRFHCRLQIGERVRETV